MKKTKQKLSATWEILTTAMVEMENPASVLLGRILVSAAIGMKK